LDYLWSCGLSFFDHDNNNQQQIWLSLPPWLDKACCYWYCYWPHGIAWFIRQLPILLNVRFFPVWWDNISNPYLLDERLDVRPPFAYSNFSNHSYSCLVPLQITPHDVYLITDTRYSQNYKILHLPSQYMITGYHVHHVAQLLPNRINDIFLINDSRRACFYKNRHLLTMNKYRLFWRRFSRHILHSILKPRMTTSFQFNFDLVTSAMGKTPDVDVPFEPLSKLHNKAWFPCADWHLQSRVSNILWHATYRSLAVHMPLHRPNLV